MRRKKCARSVSLGRREWGLSIESLEHRLALACVTGVEDPLDEERLCRLNGPPDIFGQDGFTGPLVNITFDEPDLRWDSDTAELNGSAQVTDGLDGASLLLTTQLDNPQGVPTDAGLRMIYDPQTGEFQVKAGWTGLTALEIRSKSRLFTGERPEVIGNGPFNVFRPEKLFVLNPSGRREFDFGAVLPTGLTLEELDADLVISNAAMGGGTIRAESYWYADEDPELSTAPRTSLASATIYLSPEQLVDERMLLSFDYQYAVMPDDPTYSAFVDSRLATGVFIDLGKVRPPKPEFTPLPPCEQTRCRITINIDPPELESEKDRFIRFQLNSNGVPLTIDNVSLHHHSASPKVTWYELELGDEEAGSLRLLTSSDHWSPQAFIAVFDSRGKRVAGSDVTEEETSTLDFDLSGSIQLEGSVQPGSADTFFVEVMSSAPHDLSFELSKTQIDGSVMRWATAGVQKLRNGFELISDELIMETCQLEDISWDGPPLTRRTEVPGTSKLRFETEEDLWGGDYTVTINSGRCLSVYGTPIRLSSSRIDWKPSAYVGSLLEEGAVLYEGNHGMYLEFDGPVQRIYSSEPIQLIGPGGTTDLRALGFESIFGQSESRLFIGLGDLEPGDYRVVMTSAVAVDTSGNGSQIPDLTINFRVLPIPKFPDNSADEQREITDVFLDRTGDGEFGLLDYSLIGELYSRRVDLSILDMDGDGQFGASDLNRIVVDWLRPIPGDINLDGVLDQQDINQLRFRQTNVPAVWESGDFNDDLVFDVNDLLIVQREYNRLRRTDGTPSRGMRLPSQARSSAMIS